ncbi:MAG: hypothetical protein Q7J98_01985, partial [Kiritimatiellia bacterium]|nr:hypothetical protein [Kiritimatiellia bacterium]
TWLFDFGAHGKMFSPQTGRITYLCWGIFISRQLSGQIPWDHRLSSLTCPDWSNLFNYVLPRAELCEPLSKDEIDRATAFIREQDK